MRLVLDTNVIIAAFGARGLCAELFEVCLSEHTILTSEYILKEVREKLLKKIYLPLPVVNEIIDYLREELEIVKPERVEDSVCRDKEDLPVVGTATAGKAEYLITGDRELLRVKRYRDIRILELRQFWHILTGGK